MRSKGSFDTAFGLWAMGANDLDPQFRHGTGELCDRLGIFEFFVDGRLTVDFINRIFIDVVSDGPSIALDIRPRRLQKRERIFHVHELRVEDTAGGVIDIDDQDTARSAAFEPIVIRAIELHKGTYAGSAFAPGPVFGAVLAGPPKSGADHALTKGGVGEDNAMEVFQLFLRESRPESRITGFFEMPDRTVQQTRSQLVMGRFSTQAMQNPPMAFLADLGAQVSNLPAAQLQLLRCLVPGQMPVNHV